ncbi:MAG TPA: NUDIX domain-containing protein [Acidimicrobiales bacterium]|nr:NUDIX domain-containing protein [Acidimicrobiales bacterium]
MVREPLPQKEYEAIFSKVPRLTVEVVIVSANEGVLLSRRQAGPCRGLWHIPGGTVRFGELLTEAARRVPRGEIGLEVDVGPMIGYIEYPSHLELGDWPVGIAFRAAPSPTGPSPAFSHPGLVAWFAECPDEMHEEQKAFLRTHALAS